MRHHFFCFIAVCLSFLNFLQGETKYKIIDLNPPGSIESYATDINDNGQVVGVYRRESEKKFVIFLWDENTGFEDLAEFDDQYWKRIGTPKINNLGHVVGFESMPGSFFSFWYSVRQPFFWSPETGKKTMDFPKDAKLGGDIEPISLNDHDQVIIHLMDYYNAPKTGAVIQQWIWHEGEYERFKNFIPLSLSNEQVMTAIKHNVISEFFVPIIYNYQNRTEITIPFPEKMDSGIPLMINESGEVILSFIKIGIFSSTVPTYYSWNPVEGFMELPKNFHPVWINNQGFMLGTLSTKEKAKEIYLYSGSKMININADIINNNFLSIEEVRKINGSQQIVGSGRVDSKGKAHAFIIEPVQG